MTIAQISISHEQDTPVFSPNSYTVTIYMLYANKPVIQQEPKEKDQPVSVVDGQTSGTKDAGESKPLPKRRTRTVDMITVKSIKQPKRATPDTVRKWKVATWKARGGIRHMKDRRMIPFRECVKRRKALSGQPDTSVLPVTLKMRDNRPGEEGG